MFDITTLTMENKDTEKEDTKNTDDREATGVRMDKEMEDRTNHEYFERRSYEDNLH